LIKLQHDPTTKLNLYAPK